MSIQLGVNAASGILAVCVLIALVDCVIDRPEETEGFRMLCGVVLTCSVLESLLLFLRGVFM